MWSPGKNPNNTIHIDDVAGAAWAASEWIAKTGRKAANDIAGVPLQFHNDKSFTKNHPDIPAPGEKPVAPLFNLVSEDRSLAVCALCPDSLCSKGGRLQQHVAERR